MSINLIAAIGLNRELGYKNQLLCHLPNDLKHFKELTTGQFVVMGRKTYESIGHSLPNRQNIIVTRNNKYKEPLGTYVYNSLEDVIHEYQSYNENQNELFICGGAEIYKQSLKYANRIFLTVIETHFSKVDTWFPPFSFLDWKVTSNIRNEIDENNQYVHNFITYERRNFNQK
jgi:dihydrofolate reductase